MANFEINNLRKVYDGGKTGFSDFSLTINNGEFVVLLGASGSGKSAVLRTVCGLDMATSGEIKMNDVVINEFLPKDRDMAVVFPSISLYGTMSVYDNFAFGLKNRKVPKQQIDERVYNTAKLLGLENVLNRKPKNLNLYEKYRALLGRAIVRNANLILMDDPISGLDKNNRAIIRNEILKLQQRVGFTCLYATKDPIEAMTLADKIVFMEDGKIVQVGTPDELYNTPKTVSVARFIGLPKINLIEGKITDNSFNFGGGSILAEKLNTSRAYLGIRAEDIAFGGQYKAVAKKCEPAGDKFLVTFNFDGDKNDYYMFSESEVSGDIYLSFGENLNFYDARTEELL